MGLPFNGNTTASWYIVTYAIYFTLTTAERLHKSGMIYYIFSKCILPYFANINGLHLFYF